MIIPIDDRYRLKSDVNQWALQKSKPVGDELKWESFKYFHDPSNAVTELIQLRIRGSDAATLVDALEEVKKIASATLSALYPHFEVIKREAIA